MLFLWAACACALTGMMIVGMQSARSATMVPAARPASGAPGRVAPASTRIAHGYTERILSTFAGIVNSGPSADVPRGRDGTLYGTTDGGGAYGMGSVFALSPPRYGQNTWTQTTLYSFTDLNGDGRSPYAGLVIDARGALCGTTYYGSNSACGSPGVGCGIVFKLTPPDHKHGSWTETVLHAFNNVDGALPRGTPYLDAHGVLYGTTYEGGAYGLGALYALRPPQPGQSTWTETVMHSFNNAADGGFPSGPLTMDWCGSLYGTTETGGMSTSCSPNCGTVYELSPPQRGSAAWTETVLYSFADGDGAFPSGGVIADRFGALYGTASSNGWPVQQPQCYFGCGLVFKLTPSGFGKTNWTKSVLYRFLGPLSDGAAPSGKLLGDERGNLFSTTEAPSTVFELTPPIGGGSGLWTETILHALTGAPSDGFNIYSGLIDDEVGNLFGTTFYGGPTNGGTVGEISPNRYRCLGQSCR